MKYSNGFLNALFNDRWNAETASDQLIYTKNGIHIGIAYSDIHEIRLQTLKYAGERVLFYVALSILSVRLTITSSTAAGAAEESIPFSASPAAITATTCAAVAANQPATNAMPEFVVTIDRRLTIPTMILVMCPVRSNIVLIRRTRALIEKVFVQYSYKGRFVF